MFDELNNENLTDQDNAAEELERIPIGKEVEYNRIMQSSIPKPRFGEVPQPRKINHYPFDLLDVGDFFTVRKEQFGFGSLRQAVHSRNTREPGKRVWSVRMTADRTEFRVYRIK